MFGRSSTGTRTLWCGGPKPRMPAKFGPASLGTGVGGHTALKRTRGSRKIHPSATAPVTGRRGLNDNDGLRNASGLGKTQFESDCYIRHQAIFFTSPAEPHRPRTTSSIRRPSCRPARSAPRDATTPISLQSF